MLKLKKIKMMGDFLCHTYTCDFPKAAHVR